MRKLSVVFLLAAQAAAIAQYFEFPEYKCYFELPPHYAMPPFENWSSAIADYTSEQGMLNFEKFYISSPVDATYGFSIAFGTPKTANTFVHDSIFITATNKAIGSLAKYSSKRTIDGFPVFEFITTDEEGTYTTNRVYGTQDRIYMIAAYYDDSSGQSSGLVDSLLNSFHLTADVKAATPRSSDDQQDPVWWIFRALTAAGIGYGIVRYRKRKKSETQTDTF